MNASYESLYRQHDADPNDIPFLTVSDSAEYLGISKSKIYKDIRTGKLVADRSLDETTMISPRALQRAYPQLGVAEIFDLEPIATDSMPEPSAQTEASENRPDASQDKQGTSRATQYKSAVSSLELALEKRAAGDDSTTKEYCDTTKDIGTEEKTMPETRVSIEESVQSESAHPQKPNKLRIFELFAALIVSSTILLVLLQNI